MSKRLDLRRSNLSVRSRYRAVTRAIIGGGGAHSYIRVLPDYISFEISCHYNRFKKKFVRQNMNYEYAPPPPINALVTALIR